MWQMVSDLLHGEKLPDSMNEALAGLCDGSLDVGTGASNGRLISILLTTDGTRFGYEIRVSGKHACSGAAFGRAIDSYKAALQQLQFNDDSFPLDCPDPFASVRARDQLISTLTDRGLRDK